MTVTKSGVMADLKAVDDAAVRIAATIGKLRAEQAALGGKATVPTLDGDAEVEIEPGTQPGAVLILKGKGMPRLRGFGRGDLRLLLTVLVPRKLDEEQRKLLGQFEESATAATYEQDEGLFKRLKGVFH